MSGLSRTAHSRYRARRARILSGQHIVCAWCGQPIDKRLRFPHPMSPTADHVHPVSRGGSNYGRLQPMHLLCNQQKGAGFSQFDSVHARRW
ncbi:HNH endonuclease [Corynebacterium urealyticum]|uniref:HNH endonuclease n=1 Tax=Corynebacterium urealyticum TaxID=43771 RepID=UPI0039A65930